MDFNFRAAKGGLPALCNTTSPPVGRSVVRLPTSTATQLDRLGSVSGDQGKEPTPWLASNLRALGRRCNADQGFVYVVVFADAVKRAVHSTGTHDMIDLGIGKPRRVQEVVDAATTGWDLKS